MRGDHDQVRATEEFTSSGAWVSLLVLTETNWIVDAVYDARLRRLAAAVDMLLSHEHLTLQEADVVTSAPEHFKKTRRWVSPTVWYPGLPT